MHTPNTTHNTKTNSNQLAVIPPFSPSGREVATVPTTRHRRSNSDPLTPNHFFSQNLQVVQHQPHEQQLQLFEQMRQLVQPTVNHYTGTVNNVAEGAHLTLNITNNTHTAPSEQSKNTLQSPDPSKASLPRPLARRVLSSFISGLLHPASVLTLISGSIFILAKATELTFIKDIVKFLVDNGILASNFAYFETVGTLPPFIFLISAIGLLIGIIATLTACCRCTCRNIGLTEA